MSVCVCVCVRRRYDKQPHERIFFFCAFSPFYSLFLQPVTPETITLRHKKTRPCMNECDMIIRPFSHLFNTHFPFFFFLLALMVRRAPDFPSIPSKMRAEYKYKYFVKLGLCVFVFFFFYSSARVREINEYLRFVLANLSSLFTVHRCTI